MLPGSDRSPHISGSGERTRPLRPPLNATATNSAAVAVAALYNQVETIRFTARARRAGKRAAADYWQPTKFNLGIELGSVPLVTTGPEI